MTALFLPATQATQDALAAVEAGDLAGLSGALARRQQALETASPDDQAASPEDLAAALAAGVMLALRLDEFKRSLTAEYGRLTQLREGLASYSASSLPAPSFSPPSIDVRG